MIADLQAALEIARDESCEWRAWERERTRAGTIQPGDSQLVLAAATRAYTAWQRLEAAKAPAVS